MSESFFSGRSLRRGVKAGAALVAATALMTWMSLAEQSVAQAQQPAATPRVEGDLLDAPPPDAPATAPKNYGDGNAPFPQRAMPAKKIDIAETTEVKKVSHKGVEYADISFGLLSSFKYVVPGDEELSEANGKMPPAYEKQIPKTVTEYDGKSISVRGFMVPLEVDQGKVKSFVLVRNQMLCCYGAVPQMNEWIHVTMQGDNRAPFISDVPITVYGKFAAGEVMDQGMILSIYRMSGVDVELPKEL